MSKKDRRAALAGEVFIVMDPFVARGLGVEPETCLEVKPKTAGTKGQWLCIACCTPLANNFDKDSHCVKPAPKRTALVEHDTKHKHVLAWRSFDSGEIEEP